MKWKLSNLTVLLITGVITFWGSTHIIIDTGVVGGTAISIIPGITGILCLIVVILKWKKLNLLERIIGIGLVLLAIFNLVIFLDWVLSWPCFAGSVLTEMFRKLLYP